MNFFAAVYGQETGRPQAGWVARARVERFGIPGRVARPWNEPARLDRTEWRRPAPSPVTTPNPCDHEKLDEEGERWDGLS